MTLLRGLVVIGLLVTGGCKSLPMKKWVSCINPSCVECQGTGSFTCRECDGAGRVDCNRCKGEGRMIHGQWILED